ncbi:MAG TPA: SMI1/KNR4 family protein [Kofleriaceae bacterium]|nr:SMI1/KNR4 family protein [Kofleriaceae bacterium]
MARAAKRPAKAGAKKSAKKSPAARAAAKKPVPKAKAAAKKPAKAAKRAKPVKAKSRAKQAARVKPAPRAETSVPPVTQPMRAESSSDAIPRMVGPEPSDSGRRSLSARERVLRSSPVVEILDDPHPIGALRRFLEGVRHEATPQQAQIALGAAQLMLLPIARDHRGGGEVKEIIDLVLSHWDQFGDRRKGYHAQEFLKNAFIAIGVDRDRIQRLQDLVPASPSSDLLFSVAGAHAVARDKVAMLRAVERALEAGATAAQFRRDADFVVYTNDPDFSVLLARAEVPQIPVDVEPHIPTVRAALDQLVATLKEFGEPIELRPPVRLDAILDAERARKISLPNDYRALLTITNGMTLWEHMFFGAGDYRELTQLALSAQRYLQSSAEAGERGIEECVPLAKWGTPTDWLLYDPRGRLRGGEPGYLLRVDNQPQPIEDLSTVLERIEYMARETLGTN